MAAKKPKKAAQPVRPLLDASTTSPGLLVRDVKALLSLLEGTDISELDVSVGGIRVVLRRAGASPPAGYPVPTYFAQAPSVPMGSGPHPAPDLASEKGVSGEVAKGMVTIDAPMVGTFYRAASPDAGAFVEESHTIGEGQTICIIEAMKLMNEIKSEIAGRIVRVLAENGQPVEYGQPLFLVDPAPAA